MELANISSMSKYECLSAFASVQTNQNDKTHTVSACCVSSCICSPVQLLQSPLGWNSLTTTVGKHTILWLREPQADLIYIYSVYI